MKYWIDSEFSKHIPAKNPFDFFMNLQGDIFRAQKNRKTFSFTLDHQTYFAKLHFSIGFKEIFKNLLQLRLPIISAKNEWRAIQKLHQLNLATMDVVAFGEQGFFPWSKQSFLITKALSNTISLEHFCAPWNKQKSAFALKLKLLNEVAHIAKTLHEHGINHRDFYLCHFLLDKHKPKTTLYLIDLHRAQMRTKTPRRWLIKDLAGLYFSAMDIGLTKRDILRFIALYSNNSLKNNRKFWLNVKTTAEKLYVKVHGKKPHVVYRTEQC